MRVANVIPARTNNGSGVELGTFTDDTRPTGEGAELKITEALNHVASRIGDDIPDSDEIRDQSKSLVALRAAMLIELGYFPEQAKGNDSTFGALRSLYNEELPIVVKAIQEIGAGDRPGAADDSQLPSYSFPEDQGGMVGWETRW